MRYTVRFCVLQGSVLTRCADLALAVVLPVHSHVAVNNVISDYVPKNVAGKLLLAPSSIILQFLVAACRRSCICTSKAFV